jgi:hypothetical protein
MIGLGNYVSDGLGVTPGGWFARIFGGGAAVPAALPVLSVIPGGPLVLLALAGKKKACLRKYPFNRAKREACQAAAAAELASGSVTHGTAAGPVTALPGGVAPADMSPDTAEERASKAAAGGGVVSTATGILGSIPWWGWLAVAGGVGFLLLRRRD